MTRSRSIFDGAPLLDVEKHAGEALWRAVQRVIDAPICLDPAVPAVRAAHAVLVRVAATPRDDLVDRTGQARLIVGMHGLDDLGKRNALAAKCRIEAESAGKGFVHREAIGWQVPVPGADNRASRQGKLNALRVLTRECLAGAQAVFRNAPGGNVAEEDRDLPLGRVADPNGSNVEPALERLRVTLEVCGLARFRHASVGVEPELLQVRGELLDPPAAKVDTSLTLEGRIGLYETVIHRLILRIELDLDDRERRFDRVEDGLEALLAGAQSGLRGVHRRDVAGHGEQLLRLAISAEDRRYSHVPPSGRAGHGVGQTTEVPDAAGLCGGYGGFGVPITLALPEIRPRTAEDVVEVADLHHPLAALAHENEIGVEV